MAIPTVILYGLWRRHTDVRRYRWLLLAFGVFIATCGFTHVFTLVNFDVPYYRAAAAMKVLTAAASWAAVVILARLMPHILLLRSPEQIERLVADRTHELQEAEEALLEADRRKNEFLAMLAHELSRDWRRLRGVPGWPQVAG
jgi:signal transduction histidine kinase